VHIQALLLGGIAPEADAAFLYSPEGNYQGQAANLLDAVGISRAGNSADVILTEFQKLGLFLTHVLECPLEPGVSLADGRLLLQKQLSSAIARIRRSLKPKRLVLFSKELAELAGKFTETVLGFAVFTGSYGPFLLDSSPSEGGMEEFRRSLLAG